VLVDALHAAFEDREVALDGVRVNVAASGDVGVVHRHIGIDERAAQSAVGCSTSAALSKTVNAQKATIAGLTADKRRLEGDPLLL